VFIRPPQLMFCNPPFASLLDLAGRRVRLASIDQSDLILALGAVPVVLELERGVEGFEAGGLDCAVTGALPASLVGLTHVTSHASTLPLSWSSIFPLTCDHVMITSLDAQNTITLTYSGKRK
jgi:hypothetical protein